MLSREFSLFSKIFCLLITFFFSHFTIIGVCIIGMLDNGLNLLGAPFYLQNIVRGVVMIAAVALAPIVVILGVVWWLVGPGLAIALLVALGVVVVVGGKFVR